ncbi:GNAT family N-acetyltransferase [bacterium]|jgi:[ribosomal protein S5]-alanine N-acetyltransferase|nr:GNAT family N-acetyltransferase [bacterium]
MRDQRDHHREQSLVFVESERVFCRLPREEEAETILQYYEKNQAHFSPWDPERPEEFYTQSFWLDYIKRARNEFRADKTLRFCVFLKEGRELIGHANFVNFERGPFQNCRVGYSIGKDHEGKGLMSEALQICIHYLFETLDFHRVEANCIPENRRSRTLLEKLGFSEHGIAKNYLKINGSWRDHVLTSITKENWDSHLK